MRKAHFNKIFGKFVGHIAQIRKKLGLEEQIKTISKLGYRLED